MTELFNKKFTIDRTVRLAIYVLLGWGLYMLIDKLSGVLLPFVIALAFAYLLNPVVAYIQKRVKNNRTVALTITFFIILILNAAFYAVLIPSIINEVERFQEIFQTHRELLFSGNWIPLHLRNKLSDFVNSEQMDSLLSIDSIRSLLSRFLPQAWASIGSVFGILGTLVAMVAIILYLIFILKDYDSFAKNWYKYFPKSVRQHAIEFVDEFSFNMMGYFRQKTIIVLINIALFSIAFTIIGLPMALLLAIMVGIMNYIPYLQNLGLIPCLLSAGLLSIETGQTWWVLLLIVLGVFILVQILEDAVLVPWLMKEVTGMNPALMLLSIAIWGTLLGVLGMIIALPFTTLLVTYWKKYILVDNEVE